MGELFESIGKLTARYLIAIALIFALQYFPGTGFVVLMLRGPYWIPIVVNVYFLHVFIASLTRTIPRIAIVLPSAWFIVGLALGLFSDYQAYAWSRAQQWVEIARSVPAAVTRINNVSSPFGWDSEGLLRPESKNFEFVSYSKMNGDKIWVADSKPSPECRSPLRRMGDRCFRPEPTQFVTPYLQIGSGFPVPRPSRVGIQVSVSESSIVLHSPDGQQQVGTLRGARIEKMAYVLSPSAFCGPISGWQCGVVWSLFARVEERGYEGFSSRDTSALLMKALIALRDGPSRQMR